MSADSPSAPKPYFDTETLSALLLLLCTLVSLAIANSSLGSGYFSFWSMEVGPLTVKQWVNDGLMAVFFLLIGLELERELYVGELSDPKQAMLPIAGAIGGMLLPALIHYGLNSGTTTQAGAGVPMATDIAFALGALAVLGKRVPTTLRVFVVAFAAIDDLGAILVIAFFYTVKISTHYLAGAAGVWIALIVANRVFRLRFLGPYLLGGIAMWLLLLRSGVHATSAGVALAFAVPFFGTDGNRSPSGDLELALHKPVAFAVLPLFALANTGIVVAEGWMDTLWTSNGIGIFLGLLIGKPIGVTVACAIAVASGACNLAPGLDWRHIFGAGLLGGIGFTMSIFVANLAFVGDEAVTIASKLAVLLSSTAAGTIGIVWLAGSHILEERPSSGVTSVRG